jgi:hypothetical protein
MDCLEVQVKPIPTGEPLNATWEGARDQRILKVGLLMVLQMLLELEALGTMFTLEVS